MDYDQKSNPKEASKLIRTGIIYQLIATAIFSFHYVAAKQLLQKVEPIALITLRGLIGGLILLAVYYFQKQPKSRSTQFTKKDALFFFLMATFGFCLSQLFFIHGLAKTTAGNTALLINVLPLIIYAISGIVKLETFVAKKTFALVIGFAAISVYIWQQGKNIELQESMYGNVLLLISLFFLAVSLLMSQKQMTKFSPILSTGILLFGGGSMLMVFAQPDLIQAIKICFSNTEFILLFIFEVSIATALSWSCNLSAIKILGSTNASTINFLQIPIAAFLSYLYIGNTPDLAIIPLILIIIPASWVIISYKPR